MNKTIVVIIVVLCVCTGLGYGLDKEKISAPILTVILKPLNTADELPPGYHIVFDGEDYAYVNSNGYQSFFTQSTYKEAVKWAQTNYGYSNKPKSVWVKVTQ